MKRTAAAACLGVGASVLVGVGMGACDLFHSTDFQNLCDLQADAAACAVPEAAAPDVAVDAGFDGNFCSPGFDYRAAAAHACSFLGACELPLGDNAFGPCMVRALLAMDCNLDPGKPVKGALHDYWTALVNAQSCADVDGVVFPQRRPVCQGANFTCIETNARAECDRGDASVSGGESCLAQGRTCSGAGAVCTGTAGAQCAATACSGTSLQDCGDGGPDLGVDCKYYGAGSCVTTPAGPACLPSAGSPCDASAPITCIDGGVAVGCSGGTTETVNCYAFQTSPPAVTCDPSNVTSPWDIESACGALTQCPTPADSCTGNGQGLQGCARGFTFTAPCSAPLRGCTTFMTHDGTRAACAPPSP